MSEPLISVVLVVRNVERFLAESIESILAQTFRNFEFVIVDFGSTDKSKSIISGYAVKDSRIKFHEIPDCGLAQARNAGCSLTHGRYIALMDADDVSLPERLRWEVEFMEEHPKVGVVGGAVVWVDAAGTSLVTWGYPLENAELQTALLEYCPLWQPSVLMRREAFALVGGYRTSFAQAEDYDLWLRISEHFQVANLKQVVLKYRIHPHQVSLRQRKHQTLGTLAAHASAVSRRNGNPDPLNSVKEITPELLLGMGVSEAAQQSALATKYSEWIRHQCMAGEWSGALNAAIEMLQSSDWKCVEKREITDMRLMAAKLYWKNNRFLRSILTGGHAVMMRPIVAGRPLKPLLRRLGLV